MNAKEGDKDALKRVTKTGKEKWVRHFDFVSGLITNAEIRKGDKFDDQLVLTVNDVREAFKVCVGLTTRYFAKFAVCCENINLRKEVEFDTYSFKDDNGKERRGWTIKQGGEAVEHSLESNDIPRGVQNKKGKWDFSDREEFLSEHVEKWIEAAAFPSASAAKQSITEDMDGDEISF